MERTRTIDGKFTNIHGGKGTLLYRVWMGMNERCNNPHNKRYPRYGGRGIKVCEEWKNFAAFRLWAEKHGYKAGLTIDRIDTDLGYSPDNCRWATRAQQNRNYSRNHLITYNGKTLCIADWSEITGIKRCTIIWRIKAGKPMDEVFSPGDKRFNQ